MVLSVRVGVSRLLCHLDSSTDTTSHDDGWWFWSTLSFGFLDGYFGLNVEHIYPVLICLPDETLYKEIKIKILFLFI